ncbi:hypothetical protein, partial [Yoonia sp. 208BN28-4]|uniref:hypothetical protein n=1 Tax=Yoonia sp. 208BN28-4 TaxID=3126505 RepID=UPI0030B3D79F
MHDVDGANAEYEDSPEVEQMRADLCAYNALIADTFIDVPDQKLPYLEREIKSGRRQGRLARTPLCTLDNHVKRIFNRERWDCGGRFYGGWWQGVGSEFRQKTHINGQPTVEIDYRAIHIAMLCAQRGISLDGDPYVLNSGLIPGLDDRKQRKLIKSLVLVALNAVSRTAACQAFRQNSPTGSAAKRMRDAELFHLLDAFLIKHPYLTEDLCADRGIQLMRGDSDIAAYVINAMTSRGIPIL